MNVAGWIVLLAAGTGAVLLLKRGEVDNPRRGLWLAAAQ